MKIKSGGKIAGKIGIIRMETSALKSNELITGITILAVLKYSNYMEISKCMLIDPLLSYSKVLQLLNRSNSSVKSVEDLIIKESILFTNFNERYKEKLTISINAILLFEKMGLIGLRDNYAYFRGERFDFKNTTLGDKAKARIASARNLANILAKGETSDLYLSLRVEI